MRIVEKLLYGICGIIGLMLLFILLCHFNPNLAKGFAKGEEANTPTVESVSQPLATTEGNVTPVSTIENKVVENNVLGGSTSGEAGGYSSYVAPSESELKVPSELVSKTGMTLPQGKVTEVSEKRANELKKDLTKGRTGEEYTYDKNFYPYFYMLDDTEKALYKQIQANAEDLLEKFAPVVEEASAKQLQNAFTAVVNDHPELFWMNTAYGYYLDPDKKIVEIDLSYNFTAADLDANKKKFNEAVNTIVYGSRGASTDYDKEVYVHDALADLVKYDLNAPANQSAYSALVTNRTVCAGYARAFQYIMQQLGIPCYYCAGYSSGNHAWNIIKLDEYYNVDVTWDDSNPTSYDYFNCSDTDYAKDHIRRDLSVNLPPCLGSKYSDLEKNKTQDSTDNTSTTASNANTKPVSDKVALAQQVAQASQQAIQTTTPGVITEQITTTTYPAHKTDYPIFENIDEYYLECAHRMMEDGDNLVSFTLYLNDKELWEEVKAGYINKDYEKEYLNRVLAERHSSGASVSVTGQVMDDGTVKVQHNYQLY